MPSRLTRKRHLKAKQLFRHRSRALTCGVPSKRSLCEMPDPPVSLPYLVIKAQVVMIVIVSYQLYLAVGTELIEQTLNNVERVSSWPVQALNIGLFVLVLGICWLYLQSTRKDLQKLQAANDSERKEYVDSLKSMASDMGKTIERNNIIFDRIDKRLERIERAQDNVGNPRG
jgi:hypothetical protein